MYLIMLVPSYCIFWINVQACNFSAFNHMKKCVAELGISTLFQGLRETFRANWLAYTNFLPKENLESFHKKVK